MQLHDNYKPIITKLREIIKNLNKTNNNKILKKYITNNHDSDLKLFLDCRTRWTSLFKCIERFIFLEKSIKLACAELDIEFFNQLELKKNKEFCKILSIFNLASERLSRLDCTLFEAEGTIKFITLKLNALNTPLSRKFRDNVENRFSKRRSILSSLALFLKTCESDIKDLSIHIEEIITKFSTDYDYATDTSELSSPYFSHNKPERWLNTCFI